MKCFYHNDADGKCAAYWVRYFIGDILKIDFVSMDFRTPFPLDTIEKDEDVYIVDYSIDPAIMSKLLEKTTRITWIDHHITAIGKYAAYMALGESYPYPVPNRIMAHDVEFRGIRYDGIAACMLTYCYLRHMTNRGVGEIKPFEPWMMEDAPMFTKLIADWDVMALAYGDKTKQFIAAFNTGDFDPATGKDWQTSPSLPTEKMIEHGKHMIKFRDGWAKSYLSFGFLTYFQGYKCFALNLGLCNSEYFKSLQLGTYDIYIAFVFDGVQYSVSMYSKVVDVSQIALSYGGGGHVGAAGFTCTNLPFSKALNEYKE